MLNNVNLITSDDLRNRFGGISRVTLWRWQKNPQIGFPRPVKIGVKSLWKPDEISAFIDSKGTK